MALVDHPQVGVALDPSHATHAGEDVAEIARKLGDRVKHVHLRDAVGKNILVVPGDGTVDFPGARPRLARASATSGRRSSSSSMSTRRPPEVSPDLGAGQVLPGRCVRGGLKEEQEEA